VVPQNKVRKHVIKHGKQIRERKKKKKKIRRVREKCDQSDDDRQVLKKFWGNIQTSDVKGLLWK